MKTGLRGTPPRRPQKSYAVSCAAAAFLLPLSLIWMLTALNFAVLGIWLGLLFLVFLIVPSFLDTVAQIHPKAQRILRIIRVIGFAALVLVHCVPLVYFGFQRTDRLYPLRHSLWGDGALLPDDLPPHSEYCFVMETKLHGPDGHPSACLVLRTDAETLAEYDRLLSERCQRTENEPLALEGEERERYLAGLKPNERNRPQSVPYFIYRKIYDAGFTEPMEHCTVYTFGNASMWYIGAGAVIDRESGLLAIWD